MKTRSLKIQITFEPNRLSKLNLSDAYEKVVEIKSRKAKKDEKNSMTEFEIMKKTGGNSK